MFRRSPGFALPVALTLALGIGANTAIFSVFDALVLQPLTFTAAAAILMAVAVLAAMAPALRARRIAPAKALREE